ncbi:hypothetical protein [Streptomyces sp. NPDC058424]|uniref:hypothetical protein n=1 Tax=Streptomyces sp. NPDC058424 TaxID=3346491 RepID=UPI00364A4A59
MTHLRLIGTQGAPAANMITTWRFALRVEAGRQTAARWPPGASGATEWELGLLLQGLIPFTPSR